MTQGKEIKEKWKRAYYGGKYLKLQAEKMLKKSKKCDIRYSREIVNIRGKL